MQVFSEDQIINEVTMLLYKAARQTHSPLPEPTMHTYLAGILITAEKPDFNFIVQKPSDIGKIAKETWTQMNPHAIPYLISRESAAYHLASAARKNNTSHKTPAACFDYASHFAERMGKDLEAHLLGDLSRHIDTYVAFVNMYFETLHTNPNMKLTAADFESFQKYIEKMNAKKKILIN